MKHETVCALDIGTTKTCAVVAIDGPDGLEILGVGEAPSLGMRKGVVVDLEETIKSIEAATEKAERMAGVHVGDVFVGITGDHIRSTNNRAVVAVTGDDREVSSADVRRVSKPARLLISRRPADHPRAAALLHGRRTRWRRRSRRHGGRTARSRHAHHHRRVELYYERAQVRSSCRPRSRRASFSSRSQVPRRRCSPKRVKSAWCCSTSAGARPISPSIRLGSAIYTATIPGRR